MKRPPRLTRKDKIAMAAETKEKQISNARALQRAADEARRQAVKDARRCSPDLDPSVV